ncbi:hypothetical protein WI23_05520 [Burkholderia oklahomensis C6786]|nr:hypothetical protein WI23_05520 [Burkholderia oklahomensis C6786]KUY59610.1 hypothetical protein WI23_16305 [Burkholderia oklahomensis C6786]
MPACRCAGDEPGGFGNAMHPALVVACDAPFRARRIEMRERFEPGRAAACVLRASAALARRVCAREAATS